jgi:hypothetical protein
LNASKAAFDERTSATCHSLRRQVGGIERQRHFQAKIPVAFHVQDQPSVTKTEGNRERTPICANADTLLIRVHSRNWRLS